VLGGDRCSLFIDHCGDTPCEAKEDVTRPAVVDLIHDGIRLLSLSFVLSNRISLWEAPCS